jgi:hypothetical protein
MTIYDLSIYMGRRADIVSGAITSKTRDSLRQKVIQATKEAAKADNISVAADDLAFLLDSQAMFVNAPIAGLEKLDFKAMFNGQPVLDDIPIMYWQLSGTGFDNEKSLVPAGFYTVVAHEKRGAISLRKADGTTVAEGNLGIELIPEIPENKSVAALFGVSVTGGVDSFVFTKKLIKFCGHVTVSAGPSSVSLSGCIEFT